MRHFQTVSFWISPHFPCPDRYPCWILILTWSEMCVCISLSFCPGFYGRKSKARAWRRFAANLGWSCWPWLSPSFGWLKDLVLDILHGLYFFLLPIEKASYNLTYIHDAAQYPCITCSYLEALRKYNSVGCVEDRHCNEMRQAHCLRVPELRLRTYWHFWIWAIVGPAFGLKYIHVYLKQYAGF